MIFKFNEFILEAATKTTTKSKKPSFDDIQKIVDTLETITEFRKTYKKEFERAQYRSWINELFKNHPNGGKTVYTTFDDIQKIVDTLKTRKEFEDQYKPEHRKAIKKHWINELFKNHPNGGKATYMTFDDIQKIVDTIKTRPELRDENEKAYNKAIKMKWMDKLFKNHPNLGKARISREFDSIQKIVDTVKDRTEFRLKYYDEHQYATNSKWLDKLFRNHPNLGRPYSRTFDDLQKIVNTLKTRLKFDSEYPSESSKAVRNGWMDDLFQNQPNQGFKKYKSFDELQKIVDTLETRPEFRRKYRKEYDRAEGAEWLKELFKNHPNEGRVHYKSFDELKKIVDTLSDRDEFETKYPTDFIRAKNKSLLYELFKNHTNNGQPISLSFDDAQKIVNTVSGRDEFSKKYTNTYSMSQKRGWLNKLFSKHPNLGYIIIDEPNKNEYIVYAFEFPELNAVYVGLTMDVDKYLRLHTWRINKNSNDSLSKFCNKYNVEIPKPEILNKDLDSIEARKKVYYWLRRYDKKGWELIRKPSSRIGNRKAKKRKEKKI